MGIAEATFTAQILGRTTAISFEGFCFLMRLGQRHGKTRILMKNFTWFSHNT
jgi:hypothetical protein